MQFSTVQYGGSPVGPPQRVMVITALYTVLYCTVLYCTASYRTVLYYHHQRRVCHHRCRYQVPRALDLRPEVRCIPRVSGKCGMKFLIHYSLDLRYEPPVSGAPRSGPEARSAAYPKGVAASAV